MANIIFVAGLDNRVGDLDLSKQTELVKNGYGTSSNVASFRYIEKDAVVFKSIDDNPGALIILFSAGCGKSKAIANHLKSKNQSLKLLHINEPYTCSDVTKDTVNNAITLGVPKSNVYSGGSDCTGNNISGHTKLSGRTSHFQSLVPLGKLIYEIAASNPPVIGSSVVGDVGNLPPGEPGSEKVVEGTPETNTNPSIPDIPKIEEIGVIFNVEQKGIFKALNAKYNFGELSVVQEVPDDEKFIFQEEDLSELSDEYKESAYIGPEEESIFEKQDYENEEEKAETESHAEKINTSYVTSKHKLDMLPGEYTTNNKSKIKCCQIHGKPVNISIADSVLDMIEAAKKDGITLKVNSGFRPAFYPNLSTKSEGGVSVSAQSQEDLYKINCKGGVCNPDTAKPGSSKHGSGIAIDINTGARKGKFAPLNTSVYTWMVKNSWRFGFVRSVSSEEWHYEYWPDEAKSKGPYGKLPKSNALFFSDLGLNNLQPTNYS